MSPITKLALAVFLGFVSSWRIYAQKRTYDQLSTILESRKRITDSLFLAHVDTVISYYFGYASCPSASSPAAFVYWRKDGVSKVAIINEVWRQYRKKEPFTEMAIYYADCSYKPCSISYSVDYFVNSYDQIIQDTLNLPERNKGTLFVLNYPFEEMEIKVGSMKIKYSVMGNQRELKPNSYKIALLDNFRSYILSYYYSTEHLMFKD